MAGRNVANLVGLVIGASALLLTSSYLAGQERLNAAIATGVLAVTLGAAATALTYREYERQRQEMISAIGKDPRNP